jgi:hypothetical protein
VEQTLLGGVASVLTVVGSIAKIVNGPRTLLAKLGWDLPPGVDDIGLAGLDLARVGDRLNAWTALEADPAASDDDKVIALAELADAVLDALEDLGDIRFQAPQDYLDRTKIKDEFLTRIFDLYLIQGAAVASRPVFDVGALLGWFELKRFEADPSIFQVAHLRHVVRWDRVPMLFSDPTKLLRETYGWGTSTFDPDVLVTRIGGVLQHLASEVRRRELPAIPLARLHGGPPPTGQPQTQLFLPLLGSSGALDGEVGISLFGLPPTTAAGPDGGLGLAPYATGATTLRIPLSSTLSIGLSAQADLGSGLALVLRPGADPTMRTGLNEAQAGAGGPGANLQLDLTSATPQGAEPMTLLAAAGATITATSIAIAAGAVVDGGGTDATLLLQVKGGQLAFTPDGLPFLEDALSSNGLVVKADLDLSWSHRRGVQLGGRAELQTSVTIGRQIGPVSIDVLEIGLTISDAVALATSVNASVAIGPVLLTVDRIGVQAAVTPGRGNLGSADLAIQPVPPNGIGVVVDAPSVVGGGFLRFDPQKGQYSGVLQLEIAEKISVKAIGLLTTKAPDGGRGYSFIVILFVEGFTPIQLGLGFMLTGIGGLLAINRTCDEDVLREGIKNQTLNNILFPKDPIRNAPQIISTLNSVFPTKNGSYLFGPVVQICWGTPPLLTFDLGLVLELGNRTRLIVLGRIFAILPNEKLDLIRLQLNTVGILDFDQKTASIDAALYDSRLLGKFPLTGDMAMRLSWGATPQFALSIGGFHPAFKPPSGFPSLERIAISLSDSDNFKLRCDAYLAITANTLQFGAHAELYAGAGGFSVQGQIGYDVLIQFDPFTFVADFEASVQLKHGSTNLFKVKVEGELSGPRPLHVKGRATFSIFWCDFSVGFDRNLISGAPPPPPSPVVVMEKLRAALDDPRNWGGQLAEGARRMVSVRGGQDANEIALHPLGRLSVKQTVVPLELEIARFGQTTPSGARTFKINTVTMNGNGVGFDPEQDFFSPASFLDLTDDEKLAAPSFELMKAGVSLGARGFVIPLNASDLIEDETIRYETIRIDDKDPQPPPQPPPRPPVFVLNASYLDLQLKFGAAAKSDVRRTGTAKYRTGVVKNVQAPDGWTIVSREDQSKQAAPGVEAGATGPYAEAFQAAQAAKRGNPARGKELMILRASEVVSLT